MAKSHERMQLQVNFEKAPCQEIPLVGFLFSRGGRLLEKAPVQKGQLELKTPDKNPRELRLLIAPAADGRIDAVTTLAALEKFKPYEASLVANPRGGWLALTIPDFVASFWRLRMCRIRGRVIKQFSIGDLTQDRGICNARVHVCEVDRVRWWIDRIPDWVILKIPEIIVEPQWPIPVPEPGPDWSAVSLNPQPLPPAEKPAFGAVSELRRDWSSRITLAQSERLAAVLDSNVSQRLLSGNAQAIRGVLVEQFPVFHPYFCGIPWLWPYFYRCDEIALTYTDLNGGFETQYWYWDDGDQPDIYLWVEYLIDGVWTTVYKPAIPCHTYWNYACGSSLTVRITDPRVRWECNDVVDGDIVWIKTIGSSASVVHIQQTDLNVPVQGKNFNRIGLSDVSVWASPNPVGEFRRPFGGGLSFVVQFGSGLPSNGMYYYRWNYRKLRNADLSPAAPMLPASLHGGQALYKSYTYEFFDAALHKHIGVNSFKLGPVTKNGHDDLFVIPPAYPSAAPVSAPELNPLWDQNTVTVSFDSAKFADGLYEFTLELFDVNGNKLTAIPRHLFQVPDYASFAPSLDALDAYVQLSAPGSASAYRMNARIDNQRCEAQIYQIKVNGSEVASNCCGFVPYPPNANIEVAFRAYHPHNFATFDFAVQKGTCDDPVQSALTHAAGLVIGDVGVYGRDASSIYRHGFTPAQLLGICSTEGKAAFAEQLGVSVLTTDGSYRLYTLDASALAAFALEPV
ncbi:hypothetical protein [Methylomonas sp. CM2]|uniref:hypothetical protein n=1 Tax=Methylomonas sp. CM2 TaxID=3417647 RepID=UPI003CEF73BD